MQFGVNPQPSLTFPFYWYSFLQRLNHPNIVKLHGVTAGSVETNVASGKECGFFIVVDRLFETLEGRIEKWHNESEEKANAGLISRLSGESKEKKREELKERIRVAYAIADAMEYLHSLDILFRDLKPGKYSLEGWRFFRSTLDLTVSDAYRYPMQTTLVLMRMEW